MTTRTFVAYSLLLSLVPACNAELESPPSGDALTAPNTEDSTVTEAITDEADPDASGSDDTPPDATEVELSPAEACDEVAAMAAEALVKACHYDNPYTGTSECREYRGTWTVEGAADACGAVFTGVSGVLGDTPCETEGMVGRCAQASETGEVISVHFYQGEAAQLEPICGQFLGGSFCASEALGEGSDVKSPIEEALLSLKSDTVVQVEPECLDDACLPELIAAREGITLTPVGTTPEVGLIVYPGALVDPRAYAPVARRIAALGVKVIIIPMPGEMAINGHDRALDMMGDEVDTWFIAGHSMGGAMAARFAFERPELESLAGLILWAAYPSGLDDMSERDFPVLSIAGASDGVATPEEIDAAKPYLPEDTEYVMLQGGNHAQFGSYGEQEGDLSPTLTLDEQQQLIAALSVHFIGRVSSDTVPSAPAFVDLPEASTWCATAQRLLGGLDEAQGVTVSVTAHADMEGFSESAPALEMDAEVGGLEIHAHTRPFGNAQVLDAPSLLEGDLYCKLHTRAAIEGALELVGEAPQASCMDVNAAVLAWAEERAGISRPLTFSEDVVFEDVTSWVEDGVVSLSQGVLSSARVDVALDAEAQAEATYCKLWSPARALYYVETGK